MPYSSYSNFFRPIENSLQNYRIMSHPAPNTSLSLPARLAFYILPLSIILLAWEASLRTTMICTLPFLPADWFYQIWLESNNINPSCHGELESIIWIFVASATIGFSVVLMAQVLVCRVVGSFLFRSASMRKDFGLNFNAAPSTTCQ